MLLLSDHKATNLTPYWRIKSVTLPLFSIMDSRKEKSGGHLEWLIFYARRDYATCPVISEAPPVANHLLANKPSMPASPTWAQKEILGPRPSPHRSGDTRIPNSSGVAQFSGDSNHHCKDYLRYCSSLLHRDPTKPAASALVAARRHAPRDSRIPLCCQIVPTFQTLQRPNINVGCYGQ